MVASLEDDLVHLLEDLREDESIAMSRGKGDTACLLGFITVQLESILERHHIDSAPLCGKLNGQNLR